MERAKRRTPGKNRSRKWSEEVVVVVVALEEKQR